MQNRKPLEKKRPALRMQSEAQSALALDDSAITEGGAVIGVATPDNVELLILTSSTLIERNRHGKILAFHFVAAGVCAGADNEAPGVADDRVVGSTNSGTGLSFSGSRRPVCASDSSMDRSSIRAFNTKTWNPFERNSSDNRYSRHRPTHDRISSSRMTAAVFTSSGIPIAVSTGRRVGGVLLTRNFLWASAMPVTSISSMPTGITRSAFSMLMVLDISGSLFLISNCNEHHGTKTNNAWSDARRAVCRTQKMAGERDAVPEGNGHIKRPSAV